MTDDRVSTELYVRSLAPDVGVDSAINLQPDRAIPVRFVATSAAAGTVFYLVVLAVTTGQFVLVP